MLIVTINRPADIPNITTRPLQCDMFSTLDFDVMDMGDCGDPIRPFDHKYYTPPNSNLSIYVGTLCIIQ